MLENCFIPAVWLNSKFEHNCIYPDDYGSYFDACTRLIEMGHRRIAYSIFGRNEHYSQTDRREGYLAAMRVAGLTPILHELPGVPDGVEGSVAMADRVPLATRILKRPDRPTAVLSYGGEACYTWVMAAHEVGLKVPGDLALAGTVDHPLDDLGFELGRLELPVYKMGREAVRVVMQRIEEPGEDVPASVIPFEIVPGDTFGPPRSK
jgi:DNA-binding LacI/PurR family transcriptional regulator